MYRVQPVSRVNTRRRKIYWFKGKEFERRRRAIERLRPVARRDAMPLLELALGWLRARPGVSVVLTGARNRSQVEQTFVPGARPLAAETVSEIDVIVRDVFRPVHRTPRLERAAGAWGERERFIAARLDGTTRYEAIAAEW